MSTVLSANPRTGQTVHTDRAEDTAASVESAVARAAEAFRALSALDRHARAATLRSAAAELERARPAVVAAADEETALGETRLNGELSRCVYQLELFADALDEGGFLEATIDHAGQTGMGPRPDLRRLLVPIGPVAVFGASNFPLAFSVPGGDTASALAAGCPVVVKGHSAHPRTAMVCAEALRRGLAAAGAPADAVQLVFGREAGVALVSAPAIKAVGFTGSLGGGRALLRAIGERDEPIPFYGELSGINPLVITPAAAAADPAGLAAGLFGSFTLGAGQFCTKPGLAFLPVGEAGDAIAADLASRVGASGSSFLLTAGIAEAFAGSTAELAQVEDVTLLASGAVADEGFAAGTALFEVAADRLTEPAVEERFGPATVLVRYRDEVDLGAALAVLPSSLTTTIHAAPGETGLPEFVMERMHEHTGRFVFDGFPTGVAVAWAQHHGGPWPSTNTLHTSVGVTAVRRFLRPMAWQNTPDALLPCELRDGRADLPRRIDGTLVLPGG